MRGVVIDLAVDAILEVQRKFVLLVIGVLVLLVLKLNRTGVFVIGARLVKVGLASSALGSVVVLGLWVILVGLLITCRDTMFSSVRASLLPLASFCSSLVQLRETQRIAFGCQIEEVRFLKLAFDVRNAKRFGVIGPHS